MHYDGINVLSLFDGMSCGRIALDRAGIKVKNYFSSEIKSYAIDVANENYPQDKNNRLGDVTKIKGKDLPQIDLLIGGSPCQDFSAANSNRSGLDGSKSGLFYEYVRLLEETKPKFFLLENVRMLEEHQQIITNILGCEPIIINSELVSPQLRHRLYWTNIPDVKQPKRVDIKLQDVLENGWTDRQKAKALLESDSRPLTNPVKMFHRYITFTTNLIFKSEQHYRSILVHYNEHFRGLSAIEIDEKIERENIDVGIYDGTRYLTKNEREACQTVPLGYTNILTNNHAACVLGDGWTVDVIAHIFRHIKVDDNGIMLKGQKTKILIKQKDKELW